MRFLSLAAAAGLLASLNGDSMSVMASPSKAQATTCSRNHHTSSRTQQKNFENFIHRFYIENDAVKAIEQTMSEDYIQHNPYALSGRQNAIDYVSSIVGAANFTILRHSFSNSTGWVHTKMETPGQPPAAVVDIFRFEGRCIVEHWDVFLSLPENAPNPLALF
ncbi:hypothetical protein F5X68DRAFT_230275 [Plectosphaerella plurivora]|uniref:SnoaL-like domain-containing protein n=1 Tax=Plectosphaerella plurivora TaxID=936078 RepID=A0A9P9ABY2_9PEZI|nr:hypothetical protein F5X68DRAFT_230275 [Plectosphaerella plurivora]